MKLKIDNSITIRAAEFWALDINNGEIRREIHIHGGGVMISLKNDYAVECLDIVHVEAEFV